jgi:DNA repair exonuclease SbcCD ATPase subunit
VKLKSVTAEGFRVFDDFTFEFPQVPGLYLLTGRNEDEPALGSNGVGKSSLFDAICFALFGRSARGLTGGDLLRDGATAASVLVTTDKDSVKRVWSKTRKSTLQLNDANVSDKEILERFALTHEMFTTATIIPQSEPMFADLKPLAQVALLQDLLGLERWITYAKAAGTAADFAGSAVAKTTGQGAVVRARIEALDVTDIEARRDAWEDARLIRIANADEAVLTAIAGAQPHADMDQWIAERNAAANKLRRAESNLRVLERRGEEFGAAADKLQTELSVVTGELASVTASAKALREDNALLADGEITICPSCHQTITAEHRKACLAALDTKLAAKRDLSDAKQLTIDRLKKELLAARAKTEAARTEWRNTNAAAKAVANEVITRDRVIANETHRQQTAAAALERAQLARGAIDTEVNPHLEAIAEAETKIEQAVVQLGNLEKQLAEERAGAERAELWVKSFKSIRSQLVSDALTQFAMEIVAVLEDLGLFGWEVTPMIDGAVFESARNASGFKFIVKSPNGVERDLKAFSGGELQRVRLAIQCALGAVIADTHGTALDFEFWDEPSSYLSGEGVEGLFNALRARAERLQRPIFVVDHHHVHAAAVDKVYTLVKANGRTTLEVA